MSRVSQHGRSYFCLAQLTKPTRAQGQSKTHKSYTLPPLRPITDTVPGMSFFDFLRIINKSPSAPQWITLEMIAVLR